MRRVSGPKDKLEPYLLSFIVSISSPISVCVIGYRLKYEIKIPSVTY